MSNRRQILAALRKNGFAVVRGDDSSGFFGSEATLDAAQAAAESALDELREEYDAQLFTQARFPRAFPKKLPAAPWLYGALGDRVAPAARGTTGFWYREGYSCASRCAPIDNYAYEHSPTLAAASDLARPALTFGACVSWQIHKRTFEHGPARESHTLQRATNPHAARWHASPSRAGWPLGWALALGALTPPSRPSVRQAPVGRATAA